MNHEILFRMTQEQLNAVADRVVGSGNSCLLPVRCGTGAVTWPSNTVRSSWTFYQAEEEIPVDGAEGLLKALDHSHRCIFAPSKADAERYAEYAPTALWACWEDGALLVYHLQGEALSPINVCCVTGDDLYFRFDGKDPMKAADETQTELHERTLQAFGAGTTHYLRNLTVAVAGVSGTGSIVAEQLYRLGVKRLVLVDDDVVEVRNLGRILNSTTQDAREGTNKALMMKRAFDAIGMNTEVIAAPTVILEAQTIHLLSQCDALFGCLDSADGRMQLNRVSTYYCIPYIDLGVRFQTEAGQITGISGAVRYIRPGGASLLGIGAYTTKQLMSESLRREDPEAYRARLNEKYIEGANEGSPAVISVNMLVSALGVQELLARLHPFRYTSNSEIEVISVDMCEPAIPSPSKPGTPDMGLKKHLGEGDCTPLLGLMPRREPK